jgi:hypothetical protein
VGRGSAPRLCVCVCAVFQAGVHCNSSNYSGQRGSQGGFPEEGRPALILEDGPGRKLDHSTGEQLRLAECLLSLSCAPVPGYWVLALFSIYWVMLVPYLL